MSNAANMKPTQIYITLNNQVRTIKFDLNAYAELELKYGSVEKAMNCLQEGSVGSLRNILWAGLIHNEANIDPRTGDVTSYNITPHDVGSWIVPSQMQEVSTALSEAIMATLPESQREVAKKELDKIMNNIVEETAETTTEKNEQTV